MFTYIETAGQTELKQCDYMIQGDHEAISLKHRPWNITASTPNGIVNYLCWAQFSLRFWHFWWVSSLFQWLPTISKPVLSISLIVGRLYIRISLTTRENTLVARDGEGFMEVAMLLHVLMFWGLLARPAGRSDWPAENYPVRTWRVMRKAGAARRRLAEKLHWQWFWQDSILVPVGTDPSVVRLFHAPTRTTSSGCFMLHRTVHTHWNLYGNPYRNRVEKEEETVTWWGNS